MEFKAATLGLKQLYDPLYGDQFCLGDDDNDDAKPTLIVYEAL